MDLGNGITINEALDRHVGSLDELNRTFMDYARATAEAMAPAADWSDPELPARADAEKVAAWLQDHPTNYAALRRLARQLVAGRKKRWVAAKKPLKSMLQLYPNDEADDSLYPLLAQVTRELNDTSQERIAWERLAKLSDDNVEMLARLTELTSQAEEWELARSYSQRWLAVSPLQARPHRLAAEAAENLKMIISLSAAIAPCWRIDPIDAAELHLRMAKCLQRRGELSVAKRHALLAVEEAPRFRAAHRLLLEIQSAIEQMSPANPPPPPLPTSEVVP